MKRSVLGADQAAAIEAGLDVREIVFLDWFGHWAASGTMKYHEHRGQIYWWVVRQKVIDDLPILGLKDGSRVSRFITKLIEKGMLERCEVANAGNRGKRSYVRTTEKWASLIDDHVSKSARETDDHVSESARESPRPRAEFDTSDIPSRRDIPTNKNTSRAVARVDPESREIPFPEPSQPKQPPAMKDPLQRHIDESMREVQPYENFARERGQIKTLATRCRRRDPENPEYVADAMMAAFRALRDSGDKWWSTQPFTPSALSSLWERIEAAGGKIAEEMQREREWKAWVAEG